MADDDVLIRINELVEEEHRLRTEVNGAPDGDPHYIRRGSRPCQSAGWHLIRTALSNRVVGTRRAAVRVLKSRRIHRGETGFADDLGTRMARSAQDVGGDARDLTASFEHFKSER